MQRGGIAGCEADAGLDAGGDALACGGEGKSSSPKPPVARDLAAAGHRVVGVDFSTTQIERARQLVPGARFQLADITEITFAAASFDAVVSLYTLIDLPTPSSAPSWAASANGCARQQGLCWQEAGLRMEHEQFVSEGTGGHQLIVASCAGK